MADTASSQGSRRNSIREKASIDLRTENNRNSEIGDEEKQLGRNGQQSTCKQEYKSICKDGQTSKQDDLSRQISSHSISSQRSYAGGDGYTCFAESEENRAASRQQAVLEEERKFEVNWEGSVDEDPESPRKMNKLRRWAIVLIVSSSSLCVYVRPSHWKELRNSTCNLSLSRSLRMLIDARTCTSSLYTSTYHQLMKEFHCSREVATLGLSIFVGGLGLG
jgi:hypothetical protein